MTADLPPEDPAPVRRLGENLVYRNQFAAVYDDPVRFRNGDEGSYLRIVESDGKPGVAALPICAGQVALVQVYRYPLDSLEWEIPRGFAHGNDAARSVRAELAEEIGREPDDLIPMGTVAPNSGLLASEVSLFLARYSIKVSQPADRMEVVRVKWIDTKALYAMIAREEIKDAFTLSALTIAQARKHIKFTIS
jgi:ADP-ribose diphosphatase